MTEVGDREIQGNGSRKGFSQTMACGCSISNVTTCRRLLLSESHSSDTHPYSSCLAFLICLPHRQIPSLRHWQAPQTIHSQVHVHSPTNPSTYFSRIFSSVITIQDPMLSTNNYPIKRAHCGEDDKDKKTESASARWQVPYLPQLAAKNSLIWPSVSVYIHVGSQKAVVRNRVFGIMLCFNDNRKKHAHAPILQRLLRFCAAKLPP